MSSSNSNAAARRRRAGPPPMQTNVRPPPGGGAVNAGYRIQQGPHMMNQQVGQQPVGPQNVGVKRPEDGETRTKPPMTPAQMLISHEQRLMEIESAFPDMVGKLTLEISREIESIKETTDTQGPVEFLEAKLNDLQATVASLKKSYKVISDLTAEMSTSLFKLMNAGQPAAQADESAPTFVDVKTETEDVNGTTEIEPSDVGDVNETTDIEPSAEDDVNGTTDNEASNESPAEEGVTVDTENEPSADEENEVVAIKSGKKKGKR